VLDEMTIRRPVATAEIVRAQLYHLAARANSDRRLTLQVLPLAAAVAGYFVPRSAFSIYTYPDPGDPTIVAVDTVNRDLIHTEPTTVRRYEDLFGGLQDAALESGPSLDFLIEAAKAE
jgi:hypothetical protein